MKSYCYILTIMYGWLIGGLFPDNNNNNLNNQTQQWLKENTSSQRCGEPAEPQSGYHVFLAASLHEANEATAILDSAGWLIWVAPLPSGNGCYALSYKTPSP